jgi:hypothetical protein
MRKGHEALRRVTFIARQRDFRAGSCRIRRHHASIDLKNAPRHETDTLFQRSSGRASDAPFGHLGFLLCAQAAPRAFTSR